MVSAVATMGEVSRFWCHECACHVATREADDGSGELCCASCDGNFVEEVEADDPPEEFLVETASSSDATTMSGPSDEREAMGRIHEGFGPREPTTAPRATTPQTPPAGDASMASETPPRETTGREAPSPLTELLQQLVGAGGGAGGRTARIIRSNGTPVEFYVTSPSDGGGELGEGGLFGLLAGAINAPFGGGGFIGNPGDYALGPNHLSQLINQLMQNDPNRHGAPPAAKEVVEKLPSHKVEQHEVDANAECAVCKDLFAVNDDAKDLPCAHSFHPDCITPWLNMHNSCPVCRFELPTDDQDYEERRRHQDHHNTDQAAAFTRCNSTIPVKLQPKVSIKRPFAEAVRSGESITMGMDPHEAKLLDSITKLNTLLTAIRRKHPDFLFLNESDVLLQQAQCWLSLAQLRRVSISMSTGKPSWTRQAPSFDKAVLNGIVDPLGHAREIYFDTSIAMTKSFLQGQVRVLVEEAEVMVMSGVCLRASPLALTLYNEAIQLCRSQDDHVMETLVFNKLAALRLDQDIWAKLDELTQNEMENMGEKEILRKCFDQLTRDNVHGVLHKEQLAILARDLGAHAMLTAEEIDELWKQLHVHDLRPENRNNGVEFETLWRWWLAEEMYDFRNKRLRRPM